MFTNQLSGFDDFQGRDETLGDLDLAKHGHDTLGSDDTGLLSSAVAPLGFPPSDSLFMEDGYVGVHSDAFGHVPSSGLLRANELGLATNQQSAPAPLQSQVTLTDMTGLQVGLYHKTRGGRNTFGAISSDAMVRVTKGVGKRLQLRVTFNPQQQLAMQAHSGLPLTAIPFRWQNFVVTLEETCLATGDILADKPCELDMTELLTVLPRSGDSEAEDPDDLSTEPAAEPFHVGADLVAQCELKLFHLSKTLRFRVEYNTGAQILTGYSLTFFTHDSGKSKKIAFNANNTNDAAPPSAASQGSNSAVSPTMTAARASTNVARQVAPKREAPAAATVARAPHQGTTATPTTAVADWNVSGYPASFARPEHHTDHHAMQLSAPNLNHHQLEHTYDHQHHMSSAQNGYVNAATAGAPYYGQLSSSPSESDESSLSAMAAHSSGQHAVAEHHLQQYHYYASGQYASHESASSVTSPSSSQHKSPRSSKGSRYSPTGTHEASEDSANLEVSSSSSGSGLLTPSDSSTLMDADTFSREFNSDHESHISGMHSFLGSLDGSHSSPYDAQSFSSSSATFQPPTSTQGSASSSLSSDDGTMHMHAQMGHRRTAARSPRPKALRRSADANNAAAGKARSTSRGFAFDPVDEDIDKQLSGRASTKKRKASEGSIVSSSPSANGSNDFPAVVDSSLDVRGIVRAQAFVHFSDIRFKTNVEDITDALNIVTQLRGKKYEWKDNINGAPAAAGLTGGRKVIGLIAQEVKRVLPEVVVADDNGFLSLNYTDMVPVLIEALKQHVDNSKLANTEIKDSISELRAMVDELSQRSGDTLTDTSSYVDFSDDDELEGSFQDEDLELSDSHGSFSRSTGSFRRRNSSISSASSLGGNEGDLSASSASLPEDVPLGDYDSLHHHHRSPKGSGFNLNAPSLPIAHVTLAEKQTTPRKSGGRKTSSTAILTPRPNVTLFACMTHKRLASMGSQQQETGQVFTVVTAPSGNGHMRSRSASAAFSRAMGPNGSAVSPPIAANTQPALSSSPGSSSNASGSPTAATPVSPPGSLRDSGNREKDAATGSNKKTTSQRISRGFSSFLHHIQASTSNIMNSAANSFSKGGNSSSSNASNTSASVHGSHSSDESGVSDGESGGTSTHGPNHAAGHASLSSSSGSISSTSSMTGPGTPPGSTTSGLPQPGAPQVQSLSQQMTALSLSSSTNEVRATVLTPGFTRFAATTTPPKLGRPVNRAVVITVSAWHMWANSDAEKIFLDVSDARHSLIMTGKAVSQIEALFPECSYIHTASIDMRGTVQQTVEDALTDLQRRQVPTCDANTSSAPSTPAPTTATPQAANATGTASSATGTASLQSQLEQADLVWFIGHSQGVQVCVHLCERLLRSGVLSSREQLLTILSLGGLHQTCAYNLMSLHGNPAIFAGLHNFGNSRRNFREYRQALARLLENGVPVTTVAAHQDAMVNVTSSSMEYVRHPNILRSLLVHHEFRDKFEPKHAFKKASNFTQELTRFALEMRNKNRLIDMLSFVNTTNDASADVQETTSWIVHAKTFPRDKLHHLLYSPHIEFPATVPGFYYALGATMSMFNTRAFRFHKATRQLREGIQRHREIPYAPDAYRVSLEWMITRVAQSTPSVPATIVDVPTAAVAKSKRSKGSSSSSGSGPTTGGSSPPTSKREKASAASLSTAPASSSPAPTFPPMVGVAAAFKEASNGFSYDFAEQVQLIAAQCSKAETMRLQSAFRYWRPEGPKEMLMQKLVMKSLGWSVAETPSLAQYVDGLSDIVNNEKEQKEGRGVDVPQTPSPAPGATTSSSPPNHASPINIPAHSSGGHASPRGHKKEPSNTTTATAATTANVTSSVSNLTESTD